MDNLCDDVAFFATGNEYMRDALNFNFIPHDVGGGYIADSNRDLQHNYLVAKDIFKNGGRGKIKFVLIGLLPYIVSENDKEPPTVCKIEEKVLEDYIKLCLDNGAKPVGVALPVNPSVRETYNADVLKLFRDTINKIGGKYDFTFVDLLDLALDNACFQDKTRLNSEGAAAVSTFLATRLYLKDILSPRDLCAADDNFFNMFSKHFPKDRDFSNTDRPLIHHVFCLMACEDFNRLSKTLPKEDCMYLMARVFSELTYSYLACLTNILSKDDYNELSTRIFDITVKNICLKDKIKVGFYLSSSAHWCGDELYNFFDQDERFEPTIFVFTDDYEFLNDSKKYKAHGLNIFEMKRSSRDFPVQDILFRVNPYSHNVTPAFCLANIKVKETLLVSIPYSFILLPSLNNLPVYDVCWKMFFPSAIELEKSKKAKKLGMPNGIYSGYPKLDVFFRKDVVLKFDWKMTRPDSKKIIWTPHWSIDNMSGRSSNFRWTYQFMYEFAKAHPEISWVVKPHPGLFNSSVRANIFPSSRARDEYFQKWNDLPNAQIYRGAYYQSLFATSDGIINDCISFTVEYQYVNKPMIFLTREDKKSYHYLLQEAFKGSYLVNGKDLDGLAAMIQRVFIEGDDYKAAERKEVFDKYLNYPKDNGMLASECIYKSISQDLGV